MKMGIFIAVLCLLTSGQTVRAGTATAENDVVIFTQFAAKFYKYYSLLPTKLGAALRAEAEQIRKKRERYKTLNRECQGLPSFSGVGGIQAQKLTRDQFRTVFALTNTIRSDRKTVAQNFPSPNFLERLLARVVGISDVRNLKKNILFYMDDTHRELSAGNYDEGSAKIEKLLVASEGL